MSDFKGTATIVSYAAALGLAPELKVCLHIDVPTLQPSSTELWVSFAGAELGALMTDVLNDVRAAPVVFPTLFAACFVPRVTAALIARGDLPPTLVP